MINNTPLSREFAASGRVDSCPVIDVHGHMGPFYGIWFPAGSADQMVRSMDRAGVRLLCFAHHYALMGADVGNAETVEAVRRHPTRLRGYLAVNPNYPETIAADLRSFDACSDVYVGLKFLSSYHRRKWDDPAYDEAWAFADERELMVLAHTWGGDTYCGLEMVRKIAQRCPGLKLLLAHCLHPRWDEAIQAARDFPNVYLDLCAVLDDRGAVEAFVGAGLVDRVLFGTDLPWFDPHQGVGALLSADITDEDRHKILHLNAEKLLASVGCALAIQ